MTHDGFFEFQRIANVLANTRQDERLSMLPPEDLLVLAKACIACEYDVTPDQLCNRQIRAILRDPRLVPQFDDNLNPRGTK